jgi:hypothetical protein
MWVEAILLEQDLAALVKQFVPVTIRLGDDGEIQVTDPSDIALVADVGLRIVCKARLRWSVLGIPVPVHVDSLVVLLRPEVTMTPGGQQVVFKLEIEHADLSGIPTAIDVRITELVNRELASKQVELAWDYAKTLSHVFELPDALQPLERLELTVAGARVKATREAVGLAIEFHAHVRRGPAEGPVPRRVNDAPAPPPRPGQRSIPWAGGSALMVAAGAMWAAFALGRATRR